MTIAMTQQARKIVLKLISDLRVHATNLSDVNNTKYATDLKLLTDAANTLQGLLPPKPTAEDIINEILNNQKDENINEIAARMTAEMRKAGLLNE